MIRPPRPGSVESKARSVVCNSGFYKVYSYTSLSILFFLWCFECQTNQQTNKPRVPLRLGIGRSGVALGRPRRRPAPVPLRRRLPPCVGGDDNGGGGRARRQRRRRRRRSRRRRSCHLGRARAGGLGAAGKKKVVLGYLIPQQH